MAAVGDLIAYHLTQHDADRVGWAISAGGPGSYPIEGQSVPLLVTAEDSDVVNGQVFPDAGSVLYVSGIEAGSDPGQWESTSAPAIARVSTKKS
jgi:hypothetical protein